MLTVEQLISNLKAFPPDTVVMVDGYEGDFDSPSCDGQVHKFVDGGEDVAWYYGRYEEDADNGIINGIILRRRS